MFAKIDVNEFLKYSKTRDRQCKYPFKDMKPGDRWDVPEDVKVLNVKAACNQYRIHQNVNVVCRKYQGKWIVVRLS